VHRAVKIPNFGNFISMDRYGRNEFRFFSFNKLQKIFSHFCLLASASKNLAFAQKT